MSFSRYRIWGIYALFVVLAFALNWHDRVFVFSSDFAAGKIVVWLSLIGFLGFSIYCTHRENFFKTVRTINQYWWARQIGIDLYLGVGMFLFLVYLHSGSLLVVLAWLAPILFFANLATLVYLALFYDDIISMILL